MRTVALIAAVGLGTLAVAHGTPASAAPSDVTSLTDDTGTLTIDVPIGWSDVTTSPLEYNDGTTAPAPQIVAAPNQASFFDTYTTPGVMYTAVAYDADSETALGDRYDFTGDCTDGGVDTYADSYFHGTTQTWTDCGGSTAQIVTVFASPPDQGFSVELLVQLSSPGDPALDTILDSFYVASPTTTSLTDDLGRITVSVPNAWSQVATDAAPNSAGEASPAITATTDFANLGNVPGLRYYTQPYTTRPDQLLGFGVIAGCDATDPTPYDDGTFSGLRQDYTNCPNGVDAVMVAANYDGPSDYTYVVQIFTQPGDTASVDTVLDSFNIVAAPTGL